MADKAAGRSGSTQADLRPGTDTRESVMETLLQLHVDFIALGGLDRAGPLLQQLMELAYYSAAPRSGPDEPGSKQLPKSVVN